MTDEDKEAIRGIIREEFARLAEALNYQEIDEPPNITVIEKGVAQRISATRQSFIMTDVGEAILRAFARDSQWVDPGDR